MQLLRCVSFSRYTALNMRRSRWHTVNGLLIPVHIKNNSALTSG